MSTLPGVHILKTPAYYNGTCFVLSKNGSECEKATNKLGFKIKKHVCFVWEDQNSLVHNTGKQMVLALF